MISSLIERDAVAEELNADSSPDVTSITLRRKSPHLVCRAKKGIMMEEPNPNTGPSRRGSGYLGAGLVSSVRKSYSVSSSTAGNR